MIVPVIAGVLLSLAVGMIAFTIYRCIRLLIDLNKYCEKYRKGSAD